MKKLLLFTFFAMLGLGLNAQYFYLPPTNTGQNPGNLNNDDEFPLGGGLDPSWTLVQGPSATPVWSSVQTLPINFNFNGNPVTQYKVSTSGVLTFTTSASSVPSTGNSALPSANIPDNSIMAWGLSGTGSNDNIVRKTFGTAPNRQHWIFFASYSYPGLTGWTYFSIVLEEGTDKIYIVDQRNNNALNSVNLTIGLQIDGTTAVQDINSPNTHPNATSSSALRDDNWYWEFTPGVQPQYDFAMSSLDLGQFLDLNNAPFDISGVLKNLGSETITSFDLNYSIDGGAVVTDAITGVNISELDDYSFLSPTQWNPSNPGSYNVTVWASNLNGNADENSINDSISMTLQVIDGFVERNAFHEVFTSSTCGPCTPGNINTDNVWAASFETPVVLKYQMSWPGTGDPYYTLEGLTRRTYYGVNSVPNMQIDGGWNGNSNVYTGAILDQYSAIPSFLEIGGNYQVNGQTVDINLAINPLTDLPGNNRLHIAIIEKTTVNNVKSNGETLFNDVMKKMIPDGNGTTIGALDGGFPKSYNFNYTFQGSYRLPNNATDPINHATEHSVEDFNDLDFVVWVQNNATREVYHASYGTLKPTIVDMTALSLATPDSANTNDNVVIEGEVRNNQSTVVTSFDVVYRINGGFPFRLAVTGVSLNQGDSYTFTHTNIWKPANPGYYKVEVEIDNVNGAGAGVADDLEINDHMFKYVTVTTGSVGLPVHEAAKTVSVYPNPSEGMVYINSETSIAKSLEVYTLMGHRVNAIELGSKGIYNLDMSTMAAGVYILKFQTANGSFSQRLVIE